MYRNTKTSLVNLVSDCCFSYGKLMLMFIFLTVNAYLGLEGGDFLEMRIKHLEKVGEVEKALILTKACGNCSLLPNQATFRQTYVSQLCQQLPSEEAILEVMHSNYRFGTECHARCVWF